MDLGAHQRAVVPTGEARLAQLPAGICAGASGRYAAVRTIRVGSHEPKSSHTPGADSVAVTEGYYLAANSCFAGEARAADIARGAAAIRDARARPTAPRQPLHPDDAVVANAAAQHGRERGRGRRGRSGRGRGRAGREHDIRPSQAATTRIDVDSNSGADVATSQPIGPTQPHRHGIRAFLNELRDVDLAAEIQKRVYTLQSPPRQLRGILRNALRVAMESVLSAAGEDDERNGWKLFLLAPRMLLFEPQAMLGWQHTKSTAGNNSSAGVAGCSCYGRRQGRRKQPRVPTDRSSARPQDQLQPRRGCASEGRARRRPRALGRAVSCRQNADGLAYCTRQYGEAGGTPGPNKSSKCPLTRTWGAATPLRSPSARCACWLTFAVRGGDRLRGHQGVQKKACVRHPG